MNWKPSKWDIGNLLFALLGLAGTIFGIAYNAHEAKEMENYRDVIHEEVTRTFAEGNLQLEFDVENENRTEHFTTPITFRD